MSGEFVLSLQGWIRKALGAFVSGAPQGGFEVALAAFLDLTESEYGFVGEVLRDPAGAPYLRTHAITDIAWDEASQALLAERGPAGLEFRKLESLFGAALVTAAPVISNSPATDPRATGIPPGHPPLRAFMALPMFRGAELVGLVGLANRPGGYDAEGAPTQLQPLLEVVATLIGNWRDERARRAADAALQESEVRLRMVADATMDAYYDWDVVADVVWRNPGYVALYGGPLEATGAWWRDRVHPDDRAAAEANLRHALAARRERWRDEYRFRRSDGGFAHVLDRCYIAYGPDGRPVRVVGSMVDMTAQREVALRLAEQVAATQRLAFAVMETEQRVRGEVAGILHDEIQQLLVAAQMRVALLSAVEPERLGATIEQAQALIVDCIQATRTLSAELKPPALETDGLRGALYWLGATFERQYALSVAVRCDAQPELSQVLLEFAYSVIRELLFNVVKHSGARQASVRVSVDEGCVTVCVEDAGRGFDPRVARGPEATGLARLAERVGILGGTLAIDSAPGAGTRVTLCLLEPRVRPTARPVEAAPAPTVVSSRPPPPADARTRVMLVDDHAVIREALGAMLARQGDIDIVGGASNGKEAVERAAELRPDVVLMDVSMPVLDGVEATRLISRECPGIRVIGLSMHEESVFGPRMQAAGAFACISKDAPAAALLQVIRSAAMVTAPAPAEGGGAVGRSPAAPADLG